LEEEPEPVVYTPTRRPHPRRGRGFSLGEIREAGLNPNEARRLGIPVDRRRSSTRPQNVEGLREEYGPVIPLSTIRGVGAAAEKKLTAADIVDARDLAEADLAALAKRVSYSRKTLERWQSEARRLLKGEKAKR